MTDFHRVTLDDIDLGGRALEAVADARRKERTRVEEVGARTPGRRGSRRRKAQR